MCTDRAAIVAPPPLLFAVCIIAGLGLTWLVPVELPRTARYIALPAGGAALAAALGWAVPAWRIFIDRGTPLSPWKGATTLVTTGPYRFTRNPMYLALVLMTLGLGGVIASVWLAGSAVVLWALLDVCVVRPEERFLRRRFGVDYENYRAIVRRWF